MITPTYVVTMARYNAWQNQSLYAAAGTLDDTTRRLDRGAFFKSIHGTLAHILWGDRMWMHRFARTPKPDGGIGESVGEAAAWDALSAERVGFDAVIQDWAAGVDDEDLMGDLTFASRAVGREVTAPLGLLIAHMFNHQTHHRGQVHAMLTAAGAKPDDTDLMVMAARG